MKLLHYLFSGVALTSSALAQAPLFDMAGVPNSSLGWGMGSVGDVDGDGRDDLLLGAPTGDGLQPSSGIVEIRSSVTAFNLETFKGEHTGDRFGAAVAGIGDLTGDGVSEIAIGAPEYEPAGGNNRGAVYIINGATGAQLAKHVGALDNDKLGWCVAAAGDANADGIPDYACGAPYADSGVVGANAGMVWIRSGATFATLQSYIGEHAGDLFGYSISAVGDLTGDGKTDLVAGAPSYDLGAVSGSGRVYRLSGGTNARTNLVSGGITLGDLGYAVSALPDLNGDGKSEIAVGEPGWNGSGANTGRVLAVSGAGGAILQTYTAGVAGDRYGFSVAGLHDIDGDGRGDLIIGAPGRDSPPLFDVGAVYIVSGLLGTFLGSAGGYSNNDNMGFTVANAGDLNSDGFDDMLMAAPVNTASFVGGGWARAHLGGAPTPTGYCTAKVNSLGCTPFISYGGCASLSLGSGIVLVGQNLRPNVTGILIWSVNQNAAPFGGGILCVGPPLKRTPGQTSTVISGWPCTGQYYYQFTPAYMLANNLNAGQEVHAQYWSRDNGFPAPNNIGLTNGLTFTIVP